MVSLMNSEYSQTPVNIGNPQEMSIKDIADKILTLASSGSTLRYLDSTLDDPQRRCPDIELAKKEL
eukprot:gene31119-38456_t